MNPKTILVVMPIYNAEATLEQAIDSILGQSYGNIHLVLVNDASTDSSLEIALSYKKDPRVTVLHNSINKGAYYSRNAGLFYFKDVRWGYFTTHDSDDISYRDRFRTMLPMFRNSVVTGVQDVFERKDMFTGQTLSRSLTVAHAMYTRYIFEKIGYFETVRFGADWEHWARVTEYNKMHNRTTRAKQQSGGQSFVGTHNLTVTIPIGSKKRRDYIAISKRKHAKMIEEDNFYIDFDFDPGVTKEI